MDLIALARPAGRRRRLSIALIGSVLVSTGLLAAAGGWLGLEDRDAAPPKTATPPAARTPGWAPPPRPESILQTRPLAEWLGEIAIEAGLGLVGGPELDRKVTAVFSAKADWQERLAALMRQVAMDYSLRDGMIELAPAQSTAGDAKPDRTGSRGPAVHATTDEPASEPETSILRYRPRHARAADLAKALSRAVGSHGFNASAEPASNSLLLGGGVAEVAEARRIAEQMDVPYRRFLIEAEIVEMVTARRSDLGVQWRIESSHLGAAANFPTDASDSREGEVTVATGGTVSLRARISALEAEGQARVIARPRVLVVEGRPASIESVRILRVRLPDSTSVVAGGDDTRSAASSRAVEEFPVGITLKVEPSLLGGDRVAMRVTAKSSTLGEPLPPDDIPEEFSRLVEADFFVAHGETAVLGGLARAATSTGHSGLPVLRDIPGLGVLFGRRARERDDEELVVLVTPFLLE